MCNRATTKSVSHYGSFDVNPTPTLPTLEVLVITVRFFNGLETYVAINIRMVIIGQK